MNTSVDFHPKVSIVIPVYNGSDYLQEAIESALAQTYHNIEVIVVNDGSTDDGKTETIAKAYGDRIRYLYKDNGGVASALNVGIRHMTGEYFSWLSHDDVYYPHKIARQVELIQGEDTNAILYSDHDYIDSASQVTRVNRIKHIQPEDFKYALITGFPVNGCTVFIHKDCFQHVGMFDETLRYVQDYDLWFRMVMQGCTFKHIPEVLVKYREHPAQGSMAVIGDHALEKDQYYIRCLAELSKHENNLLSGVNPQILTLAFNLKKRGYSAPAQYAYTLFKKHLGQLNILALSYNLLYLAYMESRYRFLRYAQNKFRKSMHFIQQKRVQRFIEFNKQVHDKVALQYDEHHTEIFNPTEQIRIQKVLHEAVTHLTTPLENRCILDFGCGTGNLTRYLMQFQLPIIAADISESSLHVLCSKFQNSGIVTPLVLNGENLSDLQDCSCDLIAVYSVLHHVPDYLAMVREFLRVVKPGGVIYIDHEVAPCYWIFDQTYIQYLSELGAEAKRIHLFELGLDPLPNTIPKKLARFIKEGTEWSMKKIFMHRTAEFLHEGDIHITRYDHIHWNEIKNILRPACDLYLEQDYLLCKESDPVPLVWQKWKDQTTDMRYVIARKK